MTTTMDYEAKIRALLAQAEGTDNEHEAEAYSAKAEQLMLRWGIDVANLARDPKRPAEEIVTEWIHLKGWFAPAHLYFAALVADGLGNLRTYRMRWYKHTADSIALVGFESDVRRAQMLIASLQLQAQTALRAWWKDAPERWWMTRMQAVHAKRQFLISFATVVKNRLTAQRTKLVAEAGTSTELAVRDRKSLVDQFLDESLTLRQHRGRIQGSWYGADEGARAGSQAQLGDPSVGGGRSALDR